MLASAIAVPTFVQTKLLVRSHGASTTGSQRLVYWDAASRMALDRPLFGFGPDRFQTAGLPYIQNPVRRDNKVDANSTWFQLAAENGIPALLVFIAFLASIWRAMNLAEGDRQQATVIWSLQAALIIATVSGTFFSAELSSPFWLILAFVSAYWASLRPDRPA
jgi:O-antigen ligase